MGDYKLVERYEDGEIMLFNLKKDVGEKNDLVKQHPERAAKMRAKLHQWYQSVDAQFLQKKPNGPEAWRP